MYYSKVCNHCISLLQNCKTTKKCDYYMLSEQMYVVTKDSRIANIIEQIENHQHATFELYNILSELNEEEA